MVVARLTLAACAALPFLLIAAACGDISDPLGIDSRRVAQPDADAPVPTMPSPERTSTSTEPGGGVTEAGVDGGKPKQDAAPAVVEVSLSDLALTTVSNGSGPLEKNMSNGQAAAGDGKPLTLEGTVYNKGVGVHAASEFSVKLGGAYKSFSAAVGVDDEVGALGSVVFRVMADGAVLFDSGIMTGATPTKTLKVDVAGKNTLTLIVTDGGDGEGFDHADWCAAKLTK